MNKFLSINILFSHCQYCYFVQSGKKINITKFAFYFDIEEFFCLDYSLFVFNDPYIFK